MTGTRTGATQRVISARGCSLAARLGLLLLLVATALTGTIGVSTQRAVAQSRPDLPRTAGIVPETALMYLSLDLDQTSDQWRQADTLLNRAGFPNAVDDLERRLLAMSGTATPTPDNSMGALLGGEAALVYTHFPDAVRQALAGGTVASPPPVATPGIGAATGLAGILLPGNPDAAWTAVLDQLRREAVDQGGTLDETSYRNTKIYSLNPTDGGTSTSSSLARIDDFIVTALSRDDIEPLIDTAAGNVASLRDYVPAADLRAELHQDLLGFGFINGGGATDLYGPTYTDYLRAVAPNNLMTQQNDINVGLGIWADDPGLRFDAVAAPPDGGPIAGLPANFAPTLDARVPADTIFFQDGADLGRYGNLNGLALLLVPFITDQVASGTPVAAALNSPAQLTPAYVERQFAAAEQVLGFDLRADLLDQLVGEYALSVAASPLFIANSGISALFASGVTDEATVRESLQRSARLIEQRGTNLDVSTRQVAANTIYVVNDKAAEQAPNVEFGVVNGQLLIGSGTGIDAYVKGPSTSLADDPRYQRVMATLPDQHSQVTYLNVGRVIGLAELASAITGGAATSATPVATPTGGNPYAAIEALAGVTYEQDGHLRSTAILYIGQP